ncbi:MAG: AAA family ATPase [Dechloromonas sp.]|nr:AAA family ATPase [Dechloromonas sp.]
MRLNTLKLENFRCFDALEVDLDPQMTVLVAENGQGKSSILDAIRIALWPFVGSFDLAKTRYSPPDASIAVDDIRLIRKASHDMARQLPCAIEVSALVETQSMQWKRYRTEEKQHPKVVKESGDAIREHAKGLQALVRDPQIEGITLPVFGYYGTCRNCSGKKLTEGSKRTKAEKDSTDDSDFYIRTFAYRDALDPASTFKHFEDWFSWLMLSRAQYIFTLDQSTLSGEAKLGGPSPESAEGKDLARINHQIAAVRQAIDCVLQPTTGWQRLDFSITYEKSLVLHHPELGLMKVANLSDGIRSMLAMVGDIAYRCVKLNPHLGNEAALKTPGVVMIDEVDMHLHPGWQQTVLGQLQAAFPKIQFVVTTHSPQVISSIASEHIRVIRGNQILSTVGTEGAENSRIIKRVFLVDPRPQANQATKDLTEYLNLVYVDLWDSPRAKALRQELDARYQGEEPALTEADLHIENRIWEKSLEGDAEA